MSYNLDQGAMSTTIQTKPFILQMRDQGPETFSDVLRGRHGLEPGLQGSRSVLGHSSLRLLQAYKLLSSLKGASQQLCICMCFLTGREHLQPKCQTCHLSQYHSLQGTQHHCLIIHCLTSYIFSVVSHMFNPNFLMCVQQLD